MVSWLGFGRRKSSDPRLVTPEPGVPDGALYVDLFGARAALAPPKKASPVSLDLEPDPAPLPPAPEAVRQEPPAPRAEPEKPAPPSQSLTPRATMDALLAARRFDEAARLYPNLPVHPDEQEWRLQVGLILAQQSRDHATVLALARDLIALSPANPSGYVASSIALRLLGRPAEAKQFIDQGIAANDRAPGLWIEAALVAEANQEPELALERWAVVRTRLPNQPIGYQGALKLTVRLRQAEMTRHLATEGLARFPVDPTLLGFAARSAAERHAWDEAASHWQSLLLTAPDDPALALEAIHSLSGSGPERRQRLPHILPMVEAMRARFPDYVPAFAVHVTALRHAGRLEEAAALGVALGGSAPFDVPLAIARAGVAEKQERPSEAVSVLNAARVGAGADWQLDCATIRALSLAGEAEAAERACTTALDRYPGIIQVIEQHVALATRQGAFAEAARRADQARNAYPDDDGIRRLADRVHALQDNHANNSLGGPRQPARVAT